VLRVRNTATNTSALRNIISGALPWFTKGVAPVLGCTVPRRICVRNCSLALVTPPLKSMKAEGPVLAARAGISEAEEFLRKIVPAMLAGIADSGQPAPRREELLAGVSAEFGRHQTRRRMEEAFFARIGVAQDSAVYGLRPESGVPQNAGGWTYRLADLAAFGITDVEYLGGDDGDYPPPDKRAFLGLTIATVKR